MKSVNKLIMVLFQIMAMATLILDAKTALTGAQSGLELCIRLVIPSLFPFIFFSSQITGSLVGQRITLLRPIGRLCRISAGTEGLLAVGLIGGYPVGAQCITQTYRNGMLSEGEAKRMLGFCSNAGPSFIFGMLSGAFSDMRPLWFLWGIHILSAILTGMLLPGGSNSSVVTEKNTSQSLSEALERSLKVMATVCGWVILFRVLLAFCQHWFLWIMADGRDILFSGLLELTNGCCRLQLADAEGTRFLLASGLLAFGGVCVGLQTVSVTKGLGSGLYFPGKCLQTAISLALAYPAQMLLFTPQEQASLHPVTMLLLTIPVITAAAKIFLKPSSNLARQGV